MTDSSRRRRARVGGLAFLLLFGICTRTPAQPAPDPYVTAQAAALGHDPGALFAFVRDQISFEVYPGYLRGARGALWTRGANSLDRAALLAALLRASGVANVRFAHATLTNDQIAGLARAMLPAPSRAFGCPTGFPYDPAADSTFYNDLRQHYWVQYDAGAASSMPTPASCTFGLVTACPLRSTRSPTSPTRCAHASP